MVRFKKVAIVGVGLIGGSIALSIKRKGLAGKVVGVFRRISTMKKAMSRKVVDRATMSIADGVKDADLVILATPVSSIARIGREVMISAKKDAVITDAGSTKVSIVREMERSARRKAVAGFVGSHPMAGSEHAGVEYARDDLMEGAPCIVTRTGRTDKAALDIVVNFWKALGAKVKVMDPASHDRTVSLISHLPHIIAFSLAGAVPVDKLPYAAEGFKDTTRIASSDPELWADIFMANRSQILRGAKTFDAVYEDILAAISSGNVKRIVRLLQKAKSKRDRLGDEKAK